MLEQLQPKEVFHWFEALSAIPRGSGNTAAISGWCLSQAKAMGLSSRQDEVGNVYIYKPASDGYEEVAPVLLQGHMDMVCASAPGCGKDMTAEGLDLRTDGKLVWAEGTTLGADDGIAMAMLLALLADKTAAHPPLEVLFTVDEETGMDGALNIHPEWIQARRMINLDAECEGVLWAGCAGGNTAVIQLPVTIARHTGELVHMEIGGLTGGHAGIDIDKNRANAIHLLGRALQMLGKTGALHLIQAESPGPVNAIASKSSAKIVMDCDPETIQKEVAHIEEIFRREYRITEPGLFVTAAVQGRRSEYPTMDKVSTDRAVCLLACAPNGVQAMSADIPNLPQTSLNFGQLQVNGGVLEGKFCNRSNVSSQLEMLNDNLTAIASLLGGHISFSAGHAAWEYASESALRQRLEHVYRRMTGRAPRVAITHGGAECGVLLEKIPDMDCVAIGPDIHDVHTPKETLDVNSTANTWEFLLETLRDMQHSSEIN